MNNHPGFYAILTPNVRYCKKLEPNAKLLYAEITALCSKYGYCWASNKYFLQLFDVDERTIRRWLKSLVENNFIRVEISSKLFTKKRKITMRFDQESSTSEKSSTSGHFCPDRPDIFVPPYKNNTMSNTVIITPPREGTPPLQPDSLSMPAGGNNNPSGKEAQNTSAAAGNNNSSDIPPVKTEDPLKNVEELTPRQKPQFAKYSPPIVAKAVKYCRDPEIFMKLKGDQAFVKQMHAFCKNPEDYAETFENLGKKPQKFSKEEILSRFKRGELYNGHEFLCDNLGCGFLPSWGCGQGDNPYSVYWRNGEKANAERWKEILQKLGIKNE